MKFAIYQKCTNNVPIVYQYQKCTNNTPRASNSGSDSLSAFFLSWCQTEGITFSRLSRKPINYSSLLVIQKERELITESYRRKVQEVIDGDSFTIQKPIQEFNKIRIEGIDTPEVGQPYYKKAKRRLAGKIGGKTVTIKPVGQSYDRLVAEVYCDRQNLTRWMQERMYK